MSELVFYIQGVLAPPPDNWQELEIELDFTNNSNDATIRTSVLEWKGENAAIINKWKNGGLNGSYGIFEGIPFRIDACNGDTIFDGCIDTTSPETTWTCDIVKAAIKETQRTYFLNDLAQGFTFAYLADPQSDTTAAPGFNFNHIVASDYVSIPYVISNVPDYLQAVLLAVSIVNIINILGDKNTFGQIYKTYDKLLTEESNDDVNSIAAAASQFPNGVLSGKFILQKAVVAAELIAYTLYIIMVINSIISMLIAFMEAIVSPVRHKYGMKVVTLFQKACDYLGYKFSSSIFSSNSPYKDLIYIPKKQAYSYNAAKQDSLVTALFSVMGGTAANRKNYDDEINYPLGAVYGYYEGTFTNFILDMEKVFNAKIAIKNGTLYFERWDYFNNNAAYTLPDISSEAPFENPYSTNASEIASNYYLKWALDSSDLNTYDIYDGTSCQMQLYPNTISNSNNNLLKNLNEIALPFALARRKSSDSWIEQLMIVIFDVVSTIINALSGLTGGILPSMPTYTIGGRVGYMLLTSDFTSFPKLLIGEIDGFIDRNKVPRWKINPNNNLGKYYAGYLDAYTLMKDFHASSWAVDTLALRNPDFTTNNTTLPTSYPNQYLVYKDNEIPLCCSDFATIKDNNIINTYDQKKGRIDSLRWNPHFQTAKIDYRVQEVYTKNLGQTFIVDGQ